ncbi:transcriptional activator NhaR [Chitinivorax sp. PXF-14]|uniref:transcriptional activator NhaR n=1 Tax=Chitinivorax sp. PXF-14 TaxID=3230488 RepID=UPI003466C59F
MQLSALNYKHLRYFWAVAKEGSMTRAAERLGMSVQTVSGQVALLEQALGRSLFTQQGRGLALTDAGRAALRYADQIFLLGEQLQDALADDRFGNSLSLNVGIADALPKTIAYRLLEPALRLPQSVRLVCEEGEFDSLLADLALHRLDVVLADRPVPHGTQLRVYSHALAQCPVMIFGTPALAARYRDGFPASLARAPMLLPTRNNVLRTRLELWFDSHEIRPDVRGEFEDSALLQTFGRHGLGLFPLPTLDVQDTLAQLGVELIGTLDGVAEQCYAISAERKITHAAVEAIRSAGIAR